MTSLDRSERVARLEQGMPQGAEKSSMLRPDDVIWSRSVTANDSVVTRRQAPTRQRICTWDKQKICTCYQTNEKTCSAPADPHLRDRQEAGITALIALAIATAPTAMAPAVPEIPDYLVNTFVPRRSGAPPQREIAVRKGPLVALRAALRSDHMVRNSLYLILSSGLQAAFGFAFWIITARLFTTTDVGIASSLISATAVISFISLVGLNSTFVRYLPTARDRDALMTVGLVIAAVCSAAVASLYVVSTPVLAPRLAFILHSPALTIGFVFAAVATVVNLLTDSVFIASRKAGFNALIDGVVGGATKLLLVLMLVGTSAYGLFCASTGGFAAAGLVSLTLMAVILRWRPTIRRSLQAIRPLLRFSFANYAANFLNLLPGLIVPLIVLDRLGASATAYYFISFQIATLLYSAAFAVEQNFLAEGSQADVNWRKLRRRSRRILMLLCLPPCLVLIVAAHWVLLVFGVKYSQHGTLSLIVLAISAIPIAANNWCLAVLRLAGRLRAIVLSSAVYAGAICGLAWLLAPHGLAALSASWPVGSLLGALVAGLSRDGQARHRRTVRTRGPSFRVTLPGGVGGGGHAVPTPGRRLCGGGAAGAG
jgi:O-antigen/teichoic acid export membrane protein